MGNFTSINELLNAMLTLTKNVVLLSLNLNGTNRTQFYD